MFGFLLELFQLGHVSVEFTGVGADQGVAFSHLFFPPPLDLIWWRLERERKNSGVVL